MRRLKLVLVTLGLPILLVSYSGSLTALEMSKRFSDSELVRIFKEEGYSGTKNLRNRVILIKINGRSYIIYNEEDGDLQARYSASGYKLKMSDMNDWNRTRRLSGAHLDSDGDPVLKVDLLSNAGMTAKHVTEFFRVFISSVERFRKFILKRDKS